MVQGRRCHKWDSRAPLLFEDGRRVATVDIESLFKRVVPPSLYPPHPITGQTDLLVMRLCKLFDPTLSLLPQSYSQGHFSLAGLCSAFSGIFLLRRVYVTVWKRKIRLEYFEFLRLLSCSLEVGSVSGSLLITLSRPLPRLAIFPFRSSKAWNYLLILKVEKKDRFCFMIPDRDWTRLNFYAIN